MVLLKKKVQKKADVQPLGWCCFGNIIINS